MIIEFRDEKRAAIDIPEAASFKFEANMLILFTEEGKTTAAYRADEVSSVYPTRN